MNVSPNQMLQLIMSGANPQQLVLNYLEEQMKGTPLGANLINLAKNDKTDEIEQIARNICKQRGVDYDKEFGAFKKKYGF